MIPPILHRCSQEKQSFIKYDLNKNGTLDFQVAKSDLLQLHCKAAKHPEIKLHKAHGNYSKLSKNLDSILFEQMHGKLSWSPQELIDHVCMRCI